MIGYLINIPFICCFNILIIIIESFWDFAQTNIVISYLLQGQKKEGDEYLAKYLSFEDNKQDAYFKIGLEYHNYPKEAIEYINKLLLINPSYPGLNYTL